MRRVTPPWWERDDRTLWARLYDPHYPVLYTLYTTLMFLVTADLLLFVGHSAAGTGALARMFVLAATAHLALAIHRERRRLAHQIQVEAPPLGRVEWPAPRE